MLKVCAQIRINENVKKLHKYSPMQIHRYSGFISKILIFFLRKSKGRLCNCYDSLIVNIFSLCIFFATYSIYQISNNSNFHFWPPQRRKQEWLSGNLILIKNEKFILPKLSFTFLFAIFKQMPIVDKFKWKYSNPKS